MIFAQAGDGRYISVREQHHFRGLGADPRTITEPKPTRESSTQYVPPTQISMIPTRQLSPTQDASLISRTDGTYTTAREPVSVPREQLPVALPGSPVPIPSPPRDPTPVPDVQPAPTVPKSTRPWIQTGLTPGVPDLPPPAPAPSNGQTSQLLPSSANGSSSSKTAWIIGGGIAALAAVGLVIYFRR